MLSVHENCTRKQQLLWLVSIPIRLSHSWCKYYCTSNVSIGAPKFWGHLCKKWTTEVILGVLQPTLNTLMITWVVRFLHCCFLFLEGLIALQLDMNSTEMQSTIPEEKLGTRPDRRHGGGEFKSILTDFYREKCWQFFHSTQHLLSNAQRLSDVKPSYLALKPIRYPMNIDQTERLRTRLNSILLYVATWHTAFIQLCSITRIHNSTMK